MIRVVWQGDHRYNIYRAGQDIGCISVSRNPYHDRHSYLHFGLEEYDPGIAQELFGLMRRECGRPLQVMLYHEKDMHDFLLAGGFALKRRCYEIEAPSSALVAPVQPAVPLTIHERGSAAYAACCELLYTHYSRIHAAISPLTVDQALFCADLPDTVLCHMEHGTPVHAAFIAAGELGYEIAYICTARESDFHGFAQSLVWELFQKRDLITMECDDCDPASMEIKALFALPDSNSYNTYILD